MYGFVKKTIQASLWNAPLENNLKKNNILFIFVFKTLVYNIKLNEGKKKKKVL